MKESEFNIIHEENDSLYIYNTFSGALIALDRTHAQLFRDPNRWSSDQSFMENMEKGGYLIADDTNERDLIRRISETRRSSEDRLIYTIAPTLACNFRCPYCYESGHRYNTMTSKCITRTIQYLTNRLCETHSKHLQITWYGGEPLLCIEAIEEITKGVKREGIEYYSDIVTNGYLLTEETAKRLLSLNVKHAQVTIDGPPHIHNVRRCLPSGEDTFFRILENVSVASRYLNITIRINVDRTNVSFIDELIEYFDRYELKGRVTLYLALVGNINGSCSSNSCLSNTEFSEYEIQFLRRHIKSGYTYAHLPRFNPSICGAVSRGSEVIDPLGDLYKCWNEVGRKEQSYGTIFGGTQKGVIDKWRDYDFEISEECHECKYLPVCMGGCPHDNLIEKRKSCKSLKQNCAERICLARDYRIERLHSLQNSKQE